MGIDIIYAVYNYCTDFVINVANLTGTSYYEVNSAIFCLLWPFITCLLWLVHWRLNKKPHRKTR
ncbi:MAG: hypothetical protein ACK560_05735 [Bacteroidota bacterium]|jgi:hypothetical protein